MTTTPTTLPGGTWNLGSRMTTRFGYGAMQLAGPWVMGPPSDRDGAIAVLRDAVDQGITHIDTSAAYGPLITNELIREALHPYPDSLLIATKVGATRDAKGGWPTARTPDDLRRQVRDNLDSLGVERLDLVNMRMGDANGPQPSSINEAMETLVELQQRGLIHQLGVSNVTAEQVAEAREVAPIVCVQNMLLAVLDETSDRRMAAYREPMLQARTPAQLLKLGRQIVDDDLGSGDLRVLVELIAGSHAESGLKTEVAQRIDRWEELVTQLAARFIPRILRPKMRPESVAHAVVAGFLGLEMLRDLRGSAAATDAVLEDLEQVGRLTSSDGDMS